MAKKKSETKKAKSAEERARETLELLREYRKTGKAAIRQQIIERHLHLLAATAANMRAQFPPPIDVDDLKQAGVFGLIEAIEKFDEAKGARFQNYCIQRIRGAILDEMRLLDWVPRFVRYTTSQIKNIRQRLGSKLGRNPSDYEVAEALGISVNLLRKRQKDGQKVSIFSYHGLRDSNGEEFDDPLHLADGKEEGAHRRLEQKEVQDMIDDVLPEKEQTLLFLYYHEQRSMKEIARIFNVTESRISQLHARILEKLNKKLGI